MLHSPHGKTARYRWEAERRRSSPYLSFGTPNTRGSLLLLIVHVVDANATILCHAGSKKKLKSVTKLKRSAEYRAKRSRTGDEYNIATATKEESKALKKAKAEASLPHKQEKKRQRLLKRSQKLEIQGNKLLAEAKKVAEQYKLMTQAKKVH